MATAVPSGRSSSQDTPLPIAAVASLLRALSSLKIAVTLFSMSIFIILVGTLAQVNLDMWEVMDRYFLAWVAPIELQVFFPRSWFPNYQNVPGGFWFPGGATIGTGLVVNLLAAVSTRFKIQAKGRRLAIGAVSLLAAGAFTCLIIASGHNMMGFQSEPLLAWSTMWQLMKFGLAAATVSTAAAGIVAFSGQQARIERILVFGLATVFGLLAIYLFSAGERAYLGDSGMRILWQLFLAGTAGLAILAACIVLFKKRGPVVTIHLGIGLLMFGQYWVAKHDVEEQMTVTEGQTVSYARDIRQTELAIVRRSASNSEQVVAVPRSLLLASLNKGAPSLLGLGGSDDRVNSDGVIQHDELPFDLQVLEYYKNAELVDAAEGKQNLATAGTGLRFIAEPIQRNTGTDTGGRVDLAAAYLRLLDKSGSELGVYLLSQIASSREIAERVTVDGTEYEISLRFRRNYKPYSITLNDVRKDDYVGTSIPRNYSSDIRLVDQEADVDRPVHIWMNNPLRFGGETFYQSGYSGPPDFPAESTTLSVVTNSGWMIPYVACMVVIVGMTGHFLLTLLRFLNRRDREASKADSSESQPLGFAATWFPVAVVGLFAAALFYVSRPARAAEGEMRLHRFGALPIIADGRVKPFDTFARNNLRILSNKYSFRGRRPAEELKERWPQISKKLQGRYDGLTASELSSVEGDVDALLELLDSKTDENQYRVEEYVDKLTTKRYPAIRWLLDVIADPALATQHKVFRIDNHDVLAMLGLERTKGHVYSYAQIWDAMDEFKEQVQQASRKNVAELNTYDRKLLDLARRMERYHQIVESFQPPELPSLPSREELAADEAAGFAALRRYYDAYTEFVRRIDASKPPLAVPSDADAENTEWDSYAKAWAKASLERQLTGADPTPALSHLTKILVAYQRHDVSTFNGEVELYERMLEREPPAQLRAASGLAGRFVKRRFGSFYAFESYFNKVSPFFFCWWPYLTAFALSGFAWLGWSRGFNRAAFWLIVGTLIVHSLALLARIYLSGRPPVTNLYSSAVFIGWGGVIAGLLLEFFYRNGIGNWGASAMGFASLVIAHNLAGDGDTFTVLQAVLDTQFWLALHVVIVTLGYTATFVAGLLGIRFVLSGGSNAALRKDLSRMIYGVLCFAVLFSFFGTVLGGLWADDSWGRFWGWDPKENGALIIVLWNVLVLHCRWDGIIRDRGLAVMAIGGNIVTSWSWFGVNELGVGLHSYGFTEGVLFSLGLFVLSQILLMGIGLFPRRPSVAPQ